MKFFYTVFNILQLFTLSYAGKFAVPIPPINGNWLLHVYSGSKDFYMNTSFGTTIGDIRNSILKQISGNPILSASAFYIYDDNCNLKTCLLSNTTKTFDEYVEIYGLPNTFGYEYTVVLPKPV
jgi:hypothetical protein